MVDSSATSSLVQRLFSAIDSKDMPGILACIDADARFRFGSTPAVTGHPEIAAAIDGFFETIAGLSHTVNRTLSEDDVLVCEGTVCYTRHDGSDITLPFTNVFELFNGLIKDYRIYADIAPLYAGS